MKNSGLKNEQKVQEILQKGSNALGEKNSAGVRLFKESDLGDGIISGKLIRPKYNTDELKKSIDTEIFELLPNITPDGPPMVLKSIYDDALDRIDELTSDIVVLNTEIGNLNAKISELEIVSESLKIQTDNEILKANISEQQAITANEQVATTTIDLSNAIQNSINEAVQRVSLFARNESLEQEVVNLREQLFGLAAQTGEGAQSGGNNKFTVKVNGSRVDPEGNDIFLKTTHNAGSSRVAGVTLEVNNVTADSKITNIQFNITGSPKWFKISSGPTTIEPQLSQTYSLVYDNAVVNNAKPTKKRNFVGILVWDGRATSYADTDLEVKVTFEDSKTDSVTLNTRLYKERS